MAETDTKTKTDTVPEQAASKGELTTLRLRLPYPKALGEYANVNARDWQVLVDAIFPSAKTVEAICMAVAYCQKRELDIFKKVVHIVPMYSRSLEREIETVWPGIAEVRITATRTGVYAGKDEAVFGSDITEVLKHVDTRSGEVKKEMEFTYPEWCRLTVYKVVQGLRCAFVGPKVYWKESYATESRFSDIPNDMWANRKSGQLEKCAEAAALRAAFPEELGGEYTAEEMHGRVVDDARAGKGSAASPIIEGEIVPPRPTKSEFERKEPDPKPVPKPEAKIPPADPSKGDPRPEPDPVGETITQETSEPTQDSKPDIDEAAEHQARLDEELEGWFIEQKSELESIGKITVLSGLRDAVAEQLEGSRLKEWMGLCEERQRAIMESMRKPKK